MEENKQHKIPTPYEYYRRQRPDYFSDTKVVYKVTLTEEQFQFIMDRLSNDMKQDLFENLTKSLALRFITPNILPQTGPTGGGDGKTDLETHPVADDISERWYVCDGGCRGTEKWAFAISTMEDWEEKVKGDVKKIVETGRGFSQILFFSNRLIRSKDIKDCEDALKKKYKIPVRIFSQNWYVDKVFKQGCLDIAVKELNLSSNYCENLEEIGPRDKERRKRLDEVEHEIITRQMTTRLDTDLVDMAMEAAILSRYLELSPSEIRGRLRRAEELAAKYGTKQQLYQAIYQIGWTEYYWLENPDATYVAFMRLKEFVKEEINVARIERLVSLYFLLTTADNLKLFKKEIDIESEYRYLDSLHRFLKSDMKHQTSYLYMHIQWLEMLMIKNFEDEDMFNDLIDDLRKTLKTADSHFDIPLESNEYVLDMIGMRIKENEKFEGLIDELTELLSKRQQEIAAAGMQLRRGEQNLEAGNNVQAIRHIGQCITLFGKEQTRSEYVRACCDLGVAYIGEDLLYSGKAMLVRSASMLLHQVELEGSADYLLITVLHEICKMELRAGQIVDFFNYYHLRGVFSNLNPDFQDERLWQMISNEQNCLGVRLMAGDVSVPVYGLLPEILNRLGMVVPLDILYHKLGYNEQESNEFRKMLADNPDILTDLRKNITDDFFLFDTVIAEDSVEVETLINGCRITARSKSDIRLHACAEVVLAFIESLCSTMGFKDIAFATNHIHFDVIEIKDGNSEIVKGENSSRYVFNLNTKDIDDKKLWESLSKLVVLLFEQNAMSRDLVKLLADKQAKEHLLDRLSVFMTYLSDIENLCGGQYGEGIEAWRKEGDKEYVFQGADDLNNPFDVHRGKQADCTISSIIDFSLWDQAKWRGCGFCNVIMSLNRPMLLFCYKDIKAGIRIFEGWADLFNRKELNIRITFILHINKKHPAWYRVAVGQDINSMMGDKYSENGSKVRHVMQAMRMHTMEPNTTENVDRFRREFERCQVCGISAVAMNENNEMEINDKEKRFNKMIPVTNIVFREAWEIGINDQDCAAILPNDDPIIPEEHQHDAPILKLLEERRKMKERE